MQSTVPSFFFLNSYNGITGTSFEANFKVVIIIIFIISHHTITLLKTLNYNHVLFIVFKKKPFGFKLQMVTSTEFESVNAAVKGQCVKPLHQLAKNGGPGWT